MSVITADGVEHVIAAEPGRSIMLAIKKAGIHELVAMCGGCCACGTCHVHVDPAFIDRLPVMSEDEDFLLDSLEERDPTSRLSCQISFGSAMEGLRVTIAKEG